MKTNKPMMPLREVHDLGEWAKADPDNTQDYVCGLITATRDAATAAMKNGRKSGWLFGQDAFILAVRAIRALNQRHAIYTYGTDLAQRLPTAWNGMADALEAYARDIPRPKCWMGERPPAGIPRGIIDSGWNYPVSGDTLEVFFKWCEGKALDAFPQDRDTVETWYKTGVFNIPLNTTQTLARIEAGQGETHRRLQTTEEKILAAIADTKAEVKANGGKLDELQGTADETKAEAAGAKVAAEGARAGVSFLVHDRMGKQAANSKRGKESHEKAVRDDAERQRAERDVETALKRVADDPDVKAGKYGAILAACRRVCKQFTPLTGAKKNGRTYLPLTKADGRPLTPETLARYYRERHGGKRGKK